MRPSLLLALSFFLAPFGAHSQDRFEIDYAGVNLRFKAKWPEKFFELRPTVDLRVGPIYGSVNPISSTDLQGPLAGHQ